ncbi:uncharacterized protein LOC141719598 [Apium graveolens]|uniref:uncharacterized protein LOC141719598 n=1 Tax=Apium graveolens TaxID=4045 RepID=UPI003D7996BD
MREKTNGYDLVRTGATRSKLAKLENGKRVCDVVLSFVFWGSVDDCVGASKPLLQMLRIADDYERLALAEVASAIDYAKVQIKKIFRGGKTPIQNKVVKIIEDCWNNQMGKSLYGASLFLNLGKYFDLLETDHGHASRINEYFNDVLKKMVKDRDTRNKIIDWWDAYGGPVTELQSFSKLIVGLCYSSSGCERNWSTFELNRNRLEHQCLNDLVYVQYNRKIDSGFKKRRDLGKKFDPLVLEDLKWTVGQT